MTVLWVLSEGRTALHRVYGWVRGELDQAALPNFTSGSNANPGGLLVMDSEHRTYLGDCTKQ